MVPKLTSGNKAYPPFSFVAASEMLEYFLSKIHYLMFRLRDGVSPKLSRVPILYPSYAQQYLGMPLHMC